MRGLLGWSIFLALTFSASLAGAFEVDDSSFALYSNMCVHPDGDVLGTRIALMRLADGTYAFYEESQGFPEKGEVVKLDPRLLKKSQLDFTITEDGRSFSIKGQITRDSIVLTSGGYRLNDKPLRIKRAKLPETLSLCR